VRRFSQKNSMVTLSEINIVPLMDLVFVLLIIFVITTPLLEQSMKLDLPSGGELDSTPLKAQDIATIEISPQGLMHLEKRPMDLDQLTASLTHLYQMNPKLVVHIRADQDSPYKFVAAVIDRCQKNDMRTLSLQTEFEVKQ
jgi:biopolymer transport protein ExbD